MLPFVALVVFVWDSQATARAREAAAEAQESWVREAATRLDGRILVAFESLSLGDHLLADGVALGDLCEGLVNQLGDHYERVFAVSTTGELACSNIPGGSPDPTEVLARDYVQAALTSGRDQVGGPLLGIQSQRTSITFAHALRRGTAVLGLLIGSSDAEPIAAEAHALLDVRQVFISGRDGAVVGYPQTTDGIPAELHDSIERARGTRVGCGMVEIQDLAWTCAAVGSSGLVLVAADPASHTFAAAGVVQQSRSIHVLTVFLVGFAGIVATDFLFFRRIRRAHQAAVGEPVPWHRLFDTDEIDELARMGGEAKARLSELQATIDANQAQRNTFEREMLWLIAETVEVRYPFLRNHGDRVGRYTRQVAIRLGIERDDLDEIEFAARIHDLGKISIPDAIYLKPGPLDPIEMAQMQLHADRGAELATRMRTIPQRVPDAIRHHHERWDGGGYPGGLGGTDIPYWSRIIAVADAYDAMTESRPYRDRPLTHEEALETLRAGAGVQWDATVVVAFLEAISSGELKPGSSPPS